MYILSRRFLLKIYYPPLPLSSAYKTVLISRLLLEKASLYFFVIDYSNFFLVYIMSLSKILSKISFIILACSRCILLPLKFGKTRGDSPDDMADGRCDGPHFRTRSD